MEGFIDRFPGVYAIRSTSRLRLSEIFVLPLAREFTDNSLDFEELFTETINEILRFVITDYIARNVPLNTLQRVCIINRLDDHLVLSVQTDIINSFNQLRSAVTAIKNLTQFYVSEFVPSVSEIAPTEDCINRFLTLRCAACTENIPLLCRSVCAPLIRGCFSPFRRGLTDQLDILWNVTQQLFYVVEDLVGEIISLEPGIMNIDFESTNEIRNFVSLQFSSMDGQKMNRLIIMDGINESTYSQTWGNIVIVIVKITCFNVMVIVIVIDSPVIVLLIVIYNLNVQVIVIVIDSPVIMLLIVIYNLNIQQW